MMREVFPVESARRLRQLSVIRATVLLKLISFIGFRGQEVRLDESGLSEFTSKKGASLFFLEELLNKLCRRVGINIS